MIIKSFLPSLGQAVTKAHAQRKLLPTTNADRLFAVIQDVDRYSEFLPLCTYSKVISKRRRSSKGDNSSSFDGTLTVGLPPLFMETYTSRVLVDPKAWTISTKSIDSNLIEALSSRWKLRPVTSTSCHVDFHVEMTVSNPGVVHVLDHVLEQVAGQQVEAFERRCSQLAETQDGRILVQNEVEEEEEVPVGQ